MKDHGILLSMLSALLDYPDQPLLDALHEIRETVATHPALPSPCRSALCALIDYLDNTDLLDLQETYVATFDRGRAGSLYLFEHVHGESRDRGQAMIDLLAMYEKSGLFLDARELPDYLPVLLEFAAHEPVDRARRLLGEVADINRTIAAHLAQRGSGYAAAVAALLPLAGEPYPSNDLRTATSEKNSTAIDTEALDREWQDEPVSFLNAQSPISPQEQPVRFYSKRPSR
ncbi:nitrate reductase molybdenum cofactor assembly chaperone [Allopusillimonas ginsengisoli]|uniref:nitrate reductase molybdenum cofactor assembly chaperone n=1 Tax=Allopusillimonas ginsengisoli TaxID=453575 RepID=UPI00102060CD|nr:nitrate reductase molybdenum cofactor assembly chaperone [Allopusillimonas ginsengisoli]TEA77987.1 nitrate reductase molybdenum cofactor assembly chaperone [Allopusillimonas ginsengisoli]